MKREAQAGNESRSRFLPADFSSSSQSPTILSSVHSMCLNRAWIEPERNRRQWKFQARVYQRNTKVSSGCDSIEKCVSSSSWHNPSFHSLIYNGDDEPSSGYNIIAGCIVVLQGKCNGKPRNSCFSRKGL